MKRKQMNGYALPGSNRAFRLRAEERLRDPKRLHARLEAAIEAALRRRANPNPTGLKCWFIPRTEFEGRGVLTPYANKERRRRRRACEIARASRRRNRL